MLGTDIALNHQVVMERHREFIAEAMRQHEIDNAFGPWRISRRSWISEARAMLATTLLRAGSWLMPDDGCLPPASALELRPGR